MIKQFLLNRLRILKCQHLLSLTRVPAKNLESLFQMSKELSNWLKRMSRGKRSSRQRNQNAIFVQITKSRKWGRLDSILNEGKRRHVAQSPTQMTLILKMMAFPIRRLADHRKKSRFMMKMLMATWLRIRGRHTNFIKLMNDLVASLI